MNEQLRWLIDRLESHGITHWVESGTLLTLIRIPEEGEAGRETTGRRLVDVVVFRRYGSHA